MIIFESTAIPTVKTSPAIPGRVKVAPNIDITANIIKILLTTARLAITPEIP
jgi:hypothetical protein